MVMLLGIATIHQSMVLFKDERARANKFQAATDLARGAGKPLLVVGGPWGTFGIRKLFGVKAHGCGDLCVDIDSRACLGCPYEPADVRDLQFSDKQFGASFSSHVLEHLDTWENVQLAWNELHRVADKVFVCLPGKDNLIAWAAPEHNLWVHQVGDDTLKVEERWGGETFLIELGGTI